MFFDISSPPPLVSGATSMWLWRKDNSCRGNYSTVPICLLGHWAWHGTCACAVQVLQMMLRSPQHICEMWLPRTVRYHGTYTFASGKSGRRPVGLETALDSGHEKYMFHRAQNGRGMESHPPHLLLLPCWAWGVGWWPWCRAPMWLSGGFLPATYIL